MEFEKRILNDNLVKKSSHCTHCSSAYKYTFSLWTESFAQLLQPPLDSVLEMHHLRFPTPPITPPKVDAVKRKRKELGVAQKQRTQSVIMEIGQGHNQCHTPAQITGIDKFQACNSENLTNSSNFVCSWINCKRFLENLESLATHVTKVHAIASAVDGLYYCRWDGCPRINRGFNARYKMLVHVRTHTKEKPHQCHLCEKSFSRAENLKIHIRSHSGEKPYICTYEGCMKAYSNSSDRFKHTRTHSIEKPYMCKVLGCHKRYTDPSSLRKHIKTFKHKEQLINTDSLTDAPSIITAMESSSIDNVSKNDECTNVCDTPYRTHYHQQQQTKPAEILSFEEDEFKYYFVEKTTIPHSFWISTDQADNRNYKMNYVQEQSTHVGIDIHIELPLDLRINRIV